MLNTIITEAITNTKNAKSNILIGILKMKWRNMSVSDSKVITGYIKQVFDNIKPEAKRESEHFFTNGGKVLFTKINEGASYTSVNRRGSNIAMNISNVNDIEHELGHVIDKVQQGGNVMGRGKLLSNVDENKISDEEYLKYYEEFNGYISRFIGNLRQGKNINFSSFREFLKYLIDEFVPKNVSQEEKEDIKNFTSYNLSKDVKFKNKIIKRLSREGVDYRKVVNVSV
jgi:hypothetical protein